MATMRTAAPLHTTFGGGLAAGIAAGLASGILGTALVIGVLGVSVAPAATADDAAVEQALIQHRADERASRLEFAGPAAVERALIQHRADERESGFGIGGP